MNPPIDVILRRLTDHSGEILGQVGVPYHQTVTYARLWEHHVLPHLRRDLEDPQAGRPVAGSNQPTHHT
jgi:hypothetical protein